MNISTFRTVLSCVVMLGMVSGAYAGESKTDFYGEIDVALAQYKSEGPSSKSTIQVQSGNMETSYIGVKSSTDLGNGLTGLITLESFLQADSGDSTRFTGDKFFARSAFVGLAGSFGQITLGRNTTPYFISVILTNPFIASFGFSPMVMHSYLGGLAGDSGWSNSVSYSIPSMGGVSASFLYAAGEVPGENGVNKMGGNVFYRVGKFTGTVAYQTVDPLADGAPVPTSDKQTASFIGATYDFGVVQLYGQYQTMKDDYASGLLDFNTYQAGVSVPVNMGTILVSYAETKVTKSAKYKRKTASLAYSYKLSDKVTLYAAGYSDDYSNVTGKASNIGLGGRFKF